MKLLWRIAYYIKPSCRVCGGSGRIFKEVNGQKLYSFHYEVCDCVKKDLHMYRKAGWLK